MNAPDPPYWTLNSRFTAFRTIWVHLGLFGCLTKLGAKWVELVQKFVPRSRIGIIRIERSRSTPLDPKLTFWCVSSYLGAFGTVWLAYETRRKTGRTSAKVRDTKSRRNFSQQTHPIHPIGPLTKNFGVFRTIWVHFEPFGCLTELCAKQTEQVQKFVPRCRVGIFRKKHNRSTPLDPKLMFWCVLYYLRAYGTVWLPYGTRCKTSRTSAKVRAMKSRWNF